MPDDPPLVDDALLVELLVALLPKLLEPPVAPLDVLVEPPEVDVLLGNSLPLEPPDELLEAEEADEDDALLAEDEVLEISTSTLPLDVEVEPPLVLDVDDTLPLEVEEPPVEVEDPPVEVEEPPVEVEPPLVEVDEPPLPPLDVEVEAVKIALPLLPPKKPPVKKPPPPMPTPPLPPMATGAPPLPPTKPLFGKTGMSPWGSGMGRGAGW